MFYLRTLGELALYESEESDESLVSNSKPLIILALLATSPKYSARRDHIAELLWPDSGHTRARRSLRQALFYLSKQIGDTLIHSDDSNLTVSLDRDRLNVDVWDFDEAMKTGDHARALDLYRGKFMAGSEDKAGREVEHWIESQNSRVEVGLEVAYSKLVLTSLQAGEADTAVRYAREYAELNPLNEHSQMILVRALKAAGDEVGALAAYQAYRTLLERELDEEPAADLQETMERVRDTLLEEPSYVPLESTDAQRPRRGAAADLPDISSERSIARRALPIAAFGLLAAALLSVVIVAGRELWTPDRAAGGVDPFNRVTGRLYMAVGESNGAQLAAAQIRAGKVEIRATDFTINDLPSPDGRYIAGVVKASDGWNLQLRGEDGGGPYPITRRPGDEYAEAWSPDSRYLLYSAGTLRGDGVSYLHRLIVYELATGTHRPITELESTDRLKARWSPDGTRIAFVADRGQDPDVYVVHFDGDSLINLSEHPASDSHPAWSPEGDRIAFVSDRDGSSDLYIATSDGEELRRVTSAEVEAATPVWMGESVVAFVARVGASWDLWMVDVQTGESYRLSHRGDLHSIHASGPSIAPTSWIDTVRIAPRGEVASPGQYLELTVEVLNAAGDTVPAEEAGIKWSVTDPSIAQVTAPGAVRMLEVGRTRVVASARGWRADTLNVVSIPLIERELTPLFREDWHGPITKQWLTFGEPRPYARPEGGPEGGVFVNNGDAHFSSGAISRSVFPLQDGIAIEAHGRMDFTRKLFQTFAIALYPETKPDTVDWVDVRPVLEFAVEGPAGDTKLADAWVASREHRSTVPFPREPTEWQVYTLQVTPDGIVELVIDGVLHWRSTWQLSSEDRSMGVRAALGYQSFETEILHGPVRVYPTARYYLLEVSADTDDGEPAGVE